MRHTIILFELASRVITYISIAFFGILALPVTYNALAREVGYATTWAFQVTLYTFILASFLANPLALKAGSHFRVKLLYGLSPALDKILDSVVYFLIIAFAALLLAAGADFVIFAWQNHVTSAAVFAVPLWIPGLAMPLGGLGLLTQILLQIVNAEGIDGSDEDSNSWESW